MRLLIKFGYLGWEYTGYQTGNGERSVEDTILKVLRQSDLAQSLHSAARTDRGVSAASSAFAIDTEERPSKVMGILNSSIHGMIFHSYAMVGDEFNPRHCDYKTYRYMARRNAVGPHLKRALAPFRGTHDFRNFCKMDERNPVRTIRSIRVTSRKEMIYVDFTARSFLWNQIRTIMAFVMDQSHNEMPEDPFSLTKRYPGIAPPEPLILLDIIYEGIEFRPQVSLSKKRAYGEELDRISLRNHIMRSFEGIMEESGK